MALPGLRKENSSEVRMIVVLDPEEVVCLPFVPVSGPELRLRALDNWLVTSCWNNDADLVGRIGVLFEVVDRLVTVLVLLPGDTGKVVIAGFSPELAEYLLHVVRTNDYTWCVEVIVGVEDQITEQGLKLRVLVDCLRSIVLCVGISLLAHGESAQL